MYAVIKTGGKQYRVAAGEKIKVEQIPADVGSEITIDGASSPRSFKADCGTALSDAISSMSFAFSRRNWNTLVDDSPVGFLMYAIGTGAPKSLFSF